MKNNYYVIEGLGIVNEKVLIAEYFKQKQEYEEYYKEKMPQTYDEWKNDLINDPRSAVKEYNEMQELKDKIRNCDLTQFKNYDEYIKYCKKLVEDYLKQHKDITANEIFDLLEEIK